MRIAVAIATTGRAATLRKCVELLAAQVRAPDAIWCCGATEDDIASVRDLTCVKAITSPKGCTIQRNALMHAIGDDADVVMFTDDDFLMHPTYLAHVETLFSSEPDLVIAHGVLTGDGIKTERGYTFEEAAEMLAPVDPPHPLQGSRRRVEGVYGCNMAVRLTTARAHGVTFDERLPLYAWQEDIDFGVRLTRHGRGLQTDALTGVHLGVKGGRTSGLRLGYSQVANIVYLARKGSLSIKTASLLIGRNCAANLVGSIRRNAKVDRRGRLRGNLIALTDVVIRRRVAPERILEL